MRYTTLLFDLDHTLLDSDASESAAFEATLHEVGVDDCRRHFATYLEINKALWSRVELGEITPDEVRVTRFERLIEQSRLEADAEQMAETYTQGLSAYGDLYPGAREVLDELAPRANLALITNGLRDVQKARVERLGLADYFDAVVISAEVGAVKPGREIFDITFEKLGSPTRNSAIMLGDSLSSDMRGGTNYGIATCWYNPHGKPATAGTEIRYEIQRLEQFPGIVLTGVEPQ